jgi:hypothetical protein
VYALLPGDLSPYALEACFDYQALWAFLQVDVYYALAGRHYEEKAK